MIFVLNSGWRVEQQVSRFKTSWFNPLIFLFITYYLYLGLPIRIRMPDPKFSGYGSGFPDYGSHYGSRIRFQQNHESMLQVSKFWLWKLALTDIGLRFIAIHLDILVIMDLKSILGLALLYLYCTVLYCTVVLVLYCVILCLFTICKCSADC